MASSNARCPWASLSQQTVATRLDDVMSEELAKEFEIEDLLSASMMPYDYVLRSKAQVACVSPKSDCSSSSSSKGSLRMTSLVTALPSSTPENPGTVCSADTVKSLQQREQNVDDDFLLASMLQEQFDREARLEQSRRSALDISCMQRLAERKLKNGDSLVGDMSSSDESEETDERAQDVDRFATAARTDLLIGFKGFAKNQDGIIKTKHDADMCGRRHACKVMELTSAIATGDGAGFDMRLNNSVYNSLKVHSKMEERRAARLHDKKEKATAEMTMDLNTRLIVYKLVNRLILDEVNGCISTGKESTVYHARGGVTNEFHVPAECALKVFKTTLNEFKNRSEYIKEDFRFKDRMSKLNPRKSIQLWAEKELNNLQRIHRAGINCPEAVILKKHVLVMTFIGVDGAPAPKLKDAQLNHDQLSQAWVQCVSILKKLYQDCKLVHADLSEYNLLWHLGRVWVIDVSQAVDHLHPHALEFLLRDCSNLCAFFQKHYAANILDSKELFEEVSGLKLPGEGAELLSQIRNFVRKEDICKNDDDCLIDQQVTFDVMFGHAGPLLDVVSRAD